MTISSSLNAGVSGLNANAARLATIADNIANSSTYGYKRAGTEFNNIVTAGQQNGKYSAGGVRTSAYRLIDERASLISTANSTDLAIGGRGMLPVASIVDVQQGNPLSMRLMTTGSFRPDDDGILRTDTGMVLLGWPANVDGTVPSYPRDTIAGLQPVQVNQNQFAADPTTKMQLGVNLPATATDAGAPGTAITQSIEYFDNLGASKNLNVTYTPTVPATGSSNTWTMTITDSASNNVVVGSYTLTFDTNTTTGGTLATLTTVSGGAYDPLTGMMNLTVARGPIQLTVGKVGDPKGLTQLGDKFAPVSVSKNGSSVGNLTGVVVDETGRMSAIYDSGFSRVIYQIPVADVANPNGLIVKDNQTYEVSSESGSFFLWDAGDGPTGDVVGFSREESGTDVASELTQLIQTQRAYSSNAKIIQTVDEMWQETTNIKR